MPFQSLELQMVLMRVGRPADCPVAALFRSDSSSAPRWARASVMSALPGDQSLPHRSSFGCSTCSAQCSPPVPELLLLLPLCTLKKHRTSLDHRSSCRVFGQDLNIRLSRGSCSERVVLMRRLQILQQPISLQLHPAAWRTERPISGGGGR